MRNNLSVHRKDIDGLRALAVLSVVFYHFGLDFISGGFVGVDVFFVISGYVITSIIYPKIEKGSFSFIDFYIRRIKRIFPLLVVVCFFVFVFSFLLFDPKAYKSFSGSLLSTFLSLSNYYFYKTSGYFASATEYKPLVHTWSLSVEEQFYFIFPLFCFFLKSSLRFRLILLIISSFLLSVYASYNYPDFSYYLIFTRAWELGVGAYFALYVSINKKYSSLLNIVSLVVLLSCFFLIDSEMPFPGIVALPVVLSVCFLLVSPDGFASRYFLSFRFIGFFGLISYSMYLWHQPVLAFYKRFFELSGVSFFYLIFITILLSILSYIYVENFFRYNVKLKSKTWFFSFFGLTCLFLVLSYSGYRDGFSGRYDINYPIYKELQSSFRKQCHTDGADYLKPKDACVLGEGTKRIYVFGDSHAVEIAAAISNSNDKYSVKQLTFSSCSFKGLQPQPIGCSAWVDDVKKYLENRSGLLVLTFRFDLYDNSHYRKMFSDFVSYIERNSQLDLLVIKGTPSLDRDVYQYIYPVSPIVDSFLDYNLVYPKGFNDFAEGLSSGRVSVYDFSNHFSSGLIYNGFPVFFDDNHISLQSANVLVDKLKDGGYL